MASFEQYSINDAIDAAEADGDFSGDEKEVPKELVDAFEGVPDWDDGSEEEEEEEEHSGSESESENESDSDDKEYSKKSDFEEGEQLEDNQEDSSDSEDENYLQKFDIDLTEDYILNNHEEDLVQNYAEVLTLSKVVKDQNGNIIDEFHKTNPILTKYEKTRVLGQRTKQLNNGAKPMIKVKENIIDSYLIAEMELKEKKIPFIIRRPLANGYSEYWTLEDLEIL
jgi:DNA-directed RNA polymerase I, II, and III subunit RPABC2